MQIKMSAHASELYSKIYLKNAKQKIRKQVQPKGIRHGDWGKQKTVTRKQILKIER
jgi:hypothetical protein